ncbi:hypothetical protein GCM10010917_32390 [Paenibacillus physcomitrellae]|uniref:Uncharacterized protein n=1 Tax=Paenibacillus physcomitrellae TaxID=1619311 RepID=A0ABQ1GJ27_9BACL|nr:hypothetical protein GCM10010917_32390 [Paenibacillus physcomitrellae]
MAAVTHLLSRFTDTVTGRHMRDPKLIHYSADPPLGWMGAFYFCECYNDSKS